MAQQGVPRPQANNLEEILNLIQTTARNNTENKMRENLELFSLKNVDARLNSKWSRDTSGNRVWTDGDNKVTYNKTTSRDNVPINNLDETCFREGNQQCVRPGVESQPERNAFRNSLILQKLGFQVVERNTTLGKLKIVESVDSWVNRTKRSEDRNQANANSLNTNSIGSSALQRLRVLVDSVNMNPSILNKDFRAPKSPEAYVSPTKRVHTKTEETPIQFAWSMRGGESSNVDGEVEAINNVIKTDSFAIKLGAGLQDVQLGGGEREYALTLQQVDDKSVFALRNAYTELRAKLESKGKELDKEDVEIIEKELDKCENSMRKVLLSIHMLEAMNDMVNKGLITQDKIPFQEVRDRKDLLTKKLESRKQKLVAIINSFGQAVAIELGNKRPQETAHVPVGTEIPVSLQDLVVDL